MFDALCKGRIIFHKNLDGLMRLCLIVLYAVGLIWLAGWRYYIIKDAAGPKEKLPPTLLLYPPLHTHNPKGDGICPERCRLKRPPVESGYFCSSRQLERFKFPTGAIGGFLCVNAVQSLREKRECRGQCPMILECNEI
jgi:hypothetical protein